MIEWHDVGIILHKRDYGEDAAIVQMMTRDHGRHAGLVRGGQSKKNRGTYEPGNIVDAVWRARLADHLGNFTCETIETPVANVLNMPDQLVALTAAAALLAETMPEREPHPAVFEGTRALMGTMEADYWGEAYVKWEVLLLGELGFALDFRTCAGGGGDRLAYVSPRTGRAVSLSAGEPYRERLLTLPAFLIGGGQGGPEEVAAGLKMTGHFLRRHLLAPADRDLPTARLRLEDRVRALTGEERPAPVEPGEWLA